MLISGCGNKPARSAAIAEASSATTLSWRVHFRRAACAMLAPAKAQKCVSLA
jgi:hypothetical protein